MRPNHRKETNWEDFGKNYPESIVGFDNLKKIMVSMDTTQDLLESDQAVEIWESIKGGLEGYPWH